MLRVLFIAKFRNTLFVALLQVKCLQPILVHFLLGWEQKMLYNFFTCLDRLLKFAGYAVQLISNIIIQISGHNQIIYAYIHAILKNNKYGKISMILKIGFDDCYWFEQQ